MLTHYPLNYATPVVARKALSFGGLAHAHQQQIAQASGHWLRLREMNYFNSGSNGYFASSTPNLQSTPNFLASSSKRGPFAASAANDWSLGFAGADDGIMGPESVHLSPEELAAIDHGIDLASGGTNSLPRADFNTPLGNRAAREHNFFASTPVSNDYPETFPLRTPPETASADTGKLSAALRREQDRYRQLEEKYCQLRAKQSQAGYSDKLRLEQVIQDLQKEVRRLRTEAAAFPDRDQLTRHYEEKLAACHQHYDRKIASLIQRFEQEKQSSAEIMKARVKAEVHLMVPRIRAQCQAQTTRHTQEAVEQVKAKCASYLKKMREDLDSERRTWKDQLRLRFEEEKRQMAAQMQAKFEMRLAQERNALEKRFLDRIHRSKPAPAPAPISATADTDTPYRRFEPTNDGLWFERSFVF
jgi:hypothetical protein